MVLAPNWLGDVIMHTPLLTMLHEHRVVVSTELGRSLEIHLGIRSSWSDLFRADPRIDQLVVLDHGPRDTGVMGTARLSRLLGKGKYDSVILGPPSLRTALASWLARVPRRVGYRTDGRGILLTRGVTAAARGTFHYAQEMMELGNAWLESLGVVQERGVVSFPVSSLPGCISFPATDLGGDRPVWAIAPGTTYGEAKTWPAARLGELLELAVNDAGVRVVLLGDASASDFTARLRENFTGSWGEEIPSDAAVVDLTGKTDLSSVVGILKSSAAFVGNDSGLMHLAAALDIPVVGVFGSSNPDWTAPLGQKTRAVIAEGFDCRPCYRKDCNQSVFCLETVTAEKVLGSILGILNPDDQGKEGP